jgi:prophage regulatory protein
VSDALLSMAELTVKVSLSDTVIYDRIKAGTFPRPVHVGRASRWVASEVDRWIESLVDTRDGVPTPGLRIARGA